MVLRFFALAVVFLLSCSDFERSNPFDEKSIYYEWYEEPEIEEVELSFSDPRDKKIYKAIEFKVKTKGNPKFNITGKEYNITWMAQNLNYNAPAGSICYDNDETNCATYGRLYDFETAKTVCPSGWRLPVEGEQRLATYEYYSDGAKQEDGLSYYLSRIFGYESCYKRVPYQNPNGKTVDVCARRWIVGLGGMGYSNGNFSDKDSVGYWWTSTDGNAGKANSIHGKIRTIRTAYYADGSDLYGPELKKGSHEKSSFLSVRCVQD